MGSGSRPAALSPCTLLDNFEVHGSGRITAVYAAYASARQRPHWPMVAPLARDRYYTIGHRRINCDVRRNCVLFKLLLK